jgi:hypothetical protein
MHGRMRPILLNAALGASLPCIGKKALDFDATSIVNLRAGLISRPSTDTQEQ